MDLHCYRCHEPVTPRGECGCRDDTCLIRGDCLDVLRAMEAESVSAIVTDPPAGIGFMSKSWDHNKGGRENWVAWMQAVAAECLRIAKPGAHALVWSLPRTSHWTAWAWEGAGWQPRDRIAHCFGSGMPKSLDVSKAIDKHGGQSVAWFGPWFRMWRNERGISSNQVAELFLSKTGGITGCVRNWELGLNIPTPEQFNLIRDTFRLPFDSIEEAERKVIGKSQWSSSASHFVPGEDHTQRINLDITAPATEAAKLWDGWGTGLKPAIEDWWLFRKPLEGTIAQNVLKHGCGVLNIAACRIATGGDNTNARKDKSGGCNFFMDGDKRGPTEWNGTVGRWPANLILSHVPDAPCPACEGDYPACKLCRGTGIIPGCVCRGTKRVKGGVAIRHNSGGDTFGGDSQKPPMGDMGYVDADGLETVEDWDCHPDCPMRLFPETTSGSISGTYNNTIMANRRGERDGKPIHLQFQGDSGSAARFFYCAKASRSERGPGNHHPTIKPLDLMDYLCKLVSAPGHAGVLLDPFAGSGSTLLAATKWFERVIGIELEEESCRIAAARLKQGGDLFA